jgi:hypothetical protein
MVSEFVPVLNRFQEIGTQEGFAQGGPTRGGPTRVKAALPGSKLTIYTGEQIGDASDADGVTYPR